jgi:hypothetical protein
MSWVTKIIDDSIRAALRGSSEHALLHDHVERGGRLVGDDQLGLATVASAIARWRMPPARADTRAPRARVHRQSGRDIP